MQPNVPIPHPDDERWNLVVRMMQHHGFKAEALIETLHTVQNSFGYLDVEALSFVSANLRVPLSRVYGVATFYNFFTLEPQGKHVCTVCTGTACHIKGAANILSAFDSAFGLKVDETLADGSVSLQETRCVGSCGPAPLAMFDDETVGYLTPDLALEHIGRWMSHDA